MVTLVISTSRPHRVPSFLEQSAEIWLSFSPELFLTLSGASSLSVTITAPKGSNFFSA